MTPKSALDRTDRRLLRLLQADGRLSIAELARQVHLSATPCLERVRRLERDGYIRGYVADLDPRCSAPRSSRLCRFSWIAPHRTYSIDSRKASFGSTRCRSATWSPEDSTTS